MYVLRLADRRGHPAQPGRPRAGRRSSCPSACSTRPSASGPRTARPSSAATSKRRSASSTCCSAHFGLAAASQGTMNNLLFGDDTFGYYETICGGSGATADADGADAVHTHMTNTRLTDPEVLEARYPGAAARVLHPPRLRRRGPPPRRRRRRSAHRIPAAADAVDPLPAPRAASACAALSGGQAWSVWRNTLYVAPTDRSLTCAGMHRKSTFSRATYSPSKRPAAAVGAIPAPCRRRPDRFGSSASVFGRQSMPGARSRALQPPKFRGLAAAWPSVSARHNRRGEMAHPLPLGVQ